MKEVMKAARIPNEIFNEKAMKVPNTPNEIFNESAQH